MFTFDEKMAFYFCFSSKRIITRVIIRSVHLEYKYNNVYRSSEKKEQNRILKKHKAKLERVFFTALEIDYQGEQPLGFVIL